MTSHEDQNPARQPNLTGTESGSTGRTGDRPADVEAARMAAKRAAVDLARRSGAELTARPAFPGAQFNIPDLEPLIGLHASRRVELAARHAARDYVRQAREEGRSWHEIGQSLGLQPGTEPDSVGHTVADSAYTYVAGNPDSDYAWHYGRSFAWHCRTCDQTISDRGPYFGLADDEPGHAEGCQRLQATLAAREAEWEAGQ